MAVPDAGIDMPDRLPRIAIDLEKLRHINCGLGRFCLHLGQELLRLAPGRFAPVFFLPPGAERSFPEGGFDRIAAVRWRKEIVLRTLRPFVRPFLPAASIDLWHTTNQMSKYLPLDDRVPVVLTIHDLTFLHTIPHDDQLQKIERRLAVLQAKVDRASAIVTDTHYVADDVRKHLILGDRPLHVVPLGLAAPTPAAITRPAFLPDGPFVLTVGNCLAHKNFHVLFDLLDRLPGRRLVIAGKKATPYGNFLGREIERRGLEGRAIMPGEVSDADRQWLYEHCEAFLFPSLTEGFGFPVLEAMQCGRPVFLSRTTCLPEIAADNGFYFESFDPAAMAAVYDAGLAAHRGDPGLADRVRTHAAGYSWAATARGYLRVYESTLAGKTA
ncbi:MAG: glycosyltransferase family 4 protein [Planctomycetia bacterium]|nr:glycosyltransferase family 4 protein [Planctomycetia bacterium]